MAEDVDTAGEVRRGTGDESGASVSSPVDTTKVGNMTKNQADSQPASRTGFAFASASQRHPNKALRKRLRQVAVSFIALPALLATTGFGAVGPSSDNGWKRVSYHPAKLSFIDMPAPPEDIISLPKTRWAVTSSMESADHPGGLNLVNSQSRKVTALWPAEDFTYAYDEDAFPGCDGIPDEAIAATHGINVVRTGGRTFDLYVVYHGNRESIEVFSVDVRGSRPTASWRGCVEVPQGTRANSVTVLPDGGIAMTNPYDPDQPKLPQLFDPVVPSGQVWTWHRESSWTEVPGSDTFYPNGIEVSDDGATLFVAETGPTTRDVVAIPTTGGQQEVLAQMDFLPDNLRWTRSGTLLTTGFRPSSLPMGQEEAIDCAVAGEVPDYCVRGFDIVEIDPVAGTSEVVFSTDTAKFRFPTVAAPVGREIWVGGNATSKIAVVSGRLHYPPHGRR